MSDTTENSPAPAQEAAASESDAAVTLGRKTYATVCAFFFVSGMCGLLYQIVWTRKMVLLFGTASYAVSTVLAIFFTGLALGSWLGGRTADRTLRPLALYGWIEILVGVWAFAFILLIDRGEAFAVGLLQSAAGIRPVGIAIRGLLSAGLLIVPVTLMGATLPMLSRFVTTQETIKTGRIGALYSINTFGAVAGCLVTGFVLLATFGYTQTTQIGAGLNIGVGVLAILLSRVLKEEELWPEAADDEDEATEDDIVDSAPLDIRHKAVMGAFAISGFAALGIEVLWTRLLSIVFIGTTYAFTAVLAAMLLGIALGSGLASLFVDRVRDKFFAYGMIQALTGASCILMLAFFPGMPERYQSALGGSGFEWSTNVTQMLLLSLMAMLIPTTLFGMSFPFVLRAAAEREEFVGQEVGRLYAANTLGGVGGSLIGGFVLIPLMGAHWGIVSLSLLLGVSGLLLTLLDFKRAPGMVMKYAPIVVVAFASAFYLAPQDVSREVNRWFVPESHEVLHYAEGVEGTVVVTGPSDKDDGSDRVLWINAVQATASIEKGVRMNRFQGVLPLFFDREYRNALFIGCGSGITAGTLALSPFERIDAIEISPDVVEAAPWFETDNFHMLDNERVHFTIDDGRNYLLVSKEEYDLIMFEPMPLALAGVSTFYTTEYYELCLDHLSPTGVVTQWIPLHNGLTEELVKDLIATFIQVFPECNAWFINADLFLVGSKEPLMMNYGLLQQRLDDVPELRDGLRSAFLTDVPELLACYLTDRKGLEMFAGEGVPMTDDRPWAEFAAPRLIHEANVPDLLRAIMPLHRSPVASVMPGKVDDWRAALDKVERRYEAHKQDFEGLVRYYESGPIGHPEELFRESIKIDPDDANAKYYLSQVLLSQGELWTRWEEYEDAVDYLREGLTYTPERLELWLALGNTYHAWGRPEEAREPYRRYIELGGDSAEVQDRLEPE